MAKQLPSLDAKLISFIQEQKLFFVGTAGNDGRVNISPKGMDSLHVLGPNRVIWLNLTGSGNETAAHLLEQNRMTIMFCSFEGKALILRLYGSAKTYHPVDKGWKALASHFPDHPSARQIFDLTIDLVQTSCGYGVPYFTYEKDRDTLNKWATHKGPEGIAAYWEEKNRQSIDGKPTGM